MSSICDPALLMGGVHLTFVPDCAVLYIYRSAIPLHVASALGIYMFLYALVSLIVSN